MKRIIGAKKMTDNRFLNLYELDARQRNGKKFPYHVASRAKTADDLKAISGKIKADAVAMLGLYGGDKIVLIRQYRYPVGDYIYELPAGLVDDGEDVHTAAKREMFEETGLDFMPGHFGCYEHPFFSSPGMTDETCSLVMGTCSGIPTNTNQEASEDIQVILASKEECIRILSEEKTDVRTAYMMMYWMNWLK